MGDIDFYRALYKTVERFKRENPGVLEAITAERKAREAAEKKNGNQNKD